MRIGYLAFMAAVVLALVTAASASAARPLFTAFMDTSAFPADDGIAFSRARSAGASRVMLMLNWRATAPSGSVKPGGFDATDPAAPEYQWETIDRQVLRAKEKGLNPIIFIYHAPEWAEGAGSGPPGTVRPSPLEFGRFAQAAALRYSGSFTSSTGVKLPRVWYWQAWNEPNLTHFLSPQYENSRPVSPGWYLRMLNRFASAVHDVRASNVVIAGGTAPFATTSIRPLHFMRVMFCLTRTLTLNPNCSRARAQFDVWSHHPYTSGGPTHHAYHADNVSIGDLPEMRRVLRAAIKRGRVISASGTRKGSVPFWVTEFGWDTNRPDPRGVPAGLHGRWTAEALYRMWRSGVSVVTWFLVFDEPMKTSPYQTGLRYYNADRAAAKPKPAWQAFRFPLVAFKRTSSIFVWGRTPPSGTSRWVVIERRTSSGWRRVGGLRANGYGIFAKTYKSFRGSAVRARISGEASRPFWLAKPRTFEINYPYGPFGCGGPIAC